jgi:type I restriction enzyme, S subunit
MNKQNLKETEIREIPEDWNITNLGDRRFIDLIMGQSPPSSTYNDKGIGLPFLQGKAEFGEMYPVPILYCSNPIKIAEKNDLLLSVRAPVGDVNIAKFKSCIGRGLASIRTKHGKMNYLFLFYYLEYSKNLLDSLSMGSTFKAITKKEIENFIVLTPSLSEQKKIAEILSTVDKSIEEVDGSITNTLRLKKALMQELLTKGIGHEEFKETGIGEIPKGWNVLKIEDILSLEYGEGLTERERKGEEYPVYGSNGVIGYNSKYLIEGPGIIVGRKGTIGAIKFSKVSFWPIDTTYYVRLKEIDTNLKWLFYKLSTLGLSKLNMATGTPGLNRGLVHKLKISFPLLQEQKKIAEILSTVDERIKLLKDKRKKLERVKKGLMNDLLTGRRRVKVEA